MLERVSPGRSLLTRILVILALSITAHAQATATLLGRVVDPNGASVAGAKITATNHATGINRVGETDREGNYAIPALPVGDYEIEVQASGSTLGV